MSSDAHALALSPEPRAEDGSSEADPAYPTVSLVDPLYPCQTRALLPPPLDGVATPAMWARLAEPLRRALELLWEELGLGESGCPSSWVTLHFGRIALNAHGCERLRAALTGIAPDPALVVPPSGISRLIEAWELWRARRRRRRLEEWLDESAAQRDANLERLAARDPADLDAAVLARGPLDDARWADILVPPLLHVLEHAAADKDPALGAALALEQRWALELGQRLVSAGVLPVRAAVAYLTVDERVRAVLEPASRWNEIAERRAARVREFASLDLPTEFWGRPRAGS